MFLELFYCILKISLFTKGNYGDNKHQKNNTLSRFWQKFWIASASINYLILI